MKRCECEDCNCFKNRLGFKNTGPQWEHGKKIRKFSEIHTPADSLFSHGHLPLKSQAGGGVSKAFCMVSARPNIQTRDLHGMLGKETVSLYLLYPNLGIMHAEWLFWKVSSSGKSFSFECFRLSTHHLQEGLQRVITAFCTVSAY